jgi:hypothetical protein
MDIRVKTFRAEATARMSFLVEDLGFVGPSSTTTELVIRS